VFLVTETYRSFVSVVLKLATKVFLPCILKHSDQNDLIFFGHFKNVTVYDRKMTEKNNILIGSKTVPCRFASEMLGCELVYLLQVFSDQPIKFQERSRPGVSMLCTSWSSGGRFAVVGGSDAIIYVYHLLPEAVSVVKVVELTQHSVSDFYSGFLCCFCRISSDALVIQSRALCVAGQSRQHLVRSRRMQVCQRIVRRHCLHLEV